MPALGIVGTGLKDLPSKDVSNMLTAMLFLEWKCRGKGTSVLKTTGV